MYKTLTIFASFIIGFALILIEQSNLVEARTPVASFISVIAYSMVGTAVLFLAYKIIDWILPADVEAEIFEKQNVAAAIFKGLLLLGVAIIIAAVILAP
jgi:putative membrane protein